MPLSLNTDHWNGRYVFLDANESEFNYKHHLTKLKDIYTSYQSEFLANANTDVSAKFKGGRKISTKLYGKHGLKSTAPFMPEWEKNREKLWDDDVKTREIPQISKHPRKKSETDAKGKS